MKSANIICCVVIERPPMCARVRQGYEYRRRTADPFILGLISKLQAEVRDERLARETDEPVIGLGRTAGLPRTRSEAEITWRDSPLEFTEADFDAWERGIGTLDEDERRRR